MEPRTGGLGGEIYRLGVRRPLLVTLALNIVVVAGKLVAGLIAGSLNVISDAAHSPVDLLNNTCWPGGDKMGHRSA